MDTSSAKQDEVDIGRDGADVVGGTEPRPRGVPPVIAAAEQRAIATRAGTVGERFPPELVNVRLF